MKELCDLRLDEQAIICKIMPKSTIKRRFSDMGLISGATIKCVGISPFGDPRAYLIRGTVLALRNSDAEDILVEEVYG